MTKAFKPLLAAIAALGIALAFGATAHATQHCDHHAAAAFHANAFHGHGHHAFAQRAVFFPTAFVAPYVVNQPVYTPAPAPAPTAGPAVEYEDGTNAAPTADEVEAARTILRDAQNRAARRAAGASNPQPAPTYAATPAPTYGFNPFALALAPTPYAYLGATFASAAFVDTCVDHARGFARRFDRHGSVDVRVRHGAFGRTTIVKKQRRR